MSFTSKHYVFLSLLVICVGCLPSGADSWRQYTRGGDYPARTPSMSPDGTLIVFSSPRSGNGDIYQVNSDGSKPIRLTSDPSFETDPIFSPDGLTVAFARETNGYRHLWLMNRDGTNQKQLTHENLLDDVQSFSPDGSELLFRRGPLPTGLGRSAESFAINLRTQRVRKLNGFVEYSPDGKAIAYSSFNKTGSSDVWIMNADGSSKRFLVPGYSPRFSPDGKTILYSTENEHPGSLWKLISRDGSNDRPIGRMLDPFFTGDGKQIVYLSPTWKHELWRMELDGTNATQLDVPAGNIDFLSPCRTGFLLKLKTDDRVGDIYVIDTTSWTVQRVTSMN